jgi:hypothetical protein
VELPKSEAQRRSISGKCTGFAFSNLSPSTAFLLLIPKLVYSR